MTTAHPAATEPDRGQPKEIVVTFVAAGLCSVPGAALGPALNEQGYFVGRVERNPFWVTDGTYQAAFLATSQGVVLFAAPPN